MTNRGYFLTISPDLQARMAEAAAQGESPADFVVKWDGTPRRPWGPYLATETEEEVRRRNRPTRRLRDLRAEEVESIVLEVSLGDLSFEELAARHTVDVGVIEHVAYANASGILVQR